MKNIKFAALVPMKGHSERVPNKNIKLLNGYPLFYWIIDSLYKSTFVDAVYVDTDSKKIAKLCKKYFPKIEIINRPQKLVGDYISMNKIINYDLSQIKDHNYFLQTHSTNPFLKLRTINNAIKTFLANQNCDSLFSVNRYQSRFYDYKFRPINHNSNKLIRTQDLQPLYEENSNLYLFTRRSFNETNMRIGKKPILFPMNTLESVDIDTKKDFEFSEILSRLIDKSN